MTLIGNRERLGFELTPVSPSWSTRYGPETAGWAGLSIWVGGTNVCRHVVLGSDRVREQLYVPLGPIADWFVRVTPMITFEERAALFPTSRHLHTSLSRWADAPRFGDVDEDWWLDEREGWWARHFLSAGADGAELPALAFVRDDEHLALSWRSRYRRTGAPTFLDEQGEYSLPWVEGIEVLGEFVSYVAAAFRAASEESVYEWVAEEQPLSTESIPLETALEVFTGRRLPELESLFGASGTSHVFQKLHLDAAAVDPATSPECQVLRDLSPRLGGEVGSVLEDLGERAAHPNPQMLEKWQAARDVALDAARAGVSELSAGQYAAHGVRDYLGLNGGPVRNVRATLESLGLTYEHAEVVATRDRMIVGINEEGCGVARTLITPRTMYPWGQRFEAVRALGHILLDPIRMGALGAASGPFAQATRRRRSGAFAAEFLLPASAIAAASDGVLDGASDRQAFQRLLDEYGVGATAAAHQLLNTGWLSSPEIRDDLIAEFAGAGR